MDREAFRELMDARKDVTNAIDEAEQRSTAEAFHETILLAIARGLVYVGDCIRKADR